jgi:hypothetical protein
LSEQTINATPRTEMCDHCSLPVLVILSEPEGKPIRLDPQVRRMMRIVAVTALHSVAVPTEVHELHAITCKAINT